MSDAPLGALRHTFSACKRLAFIAASVSYVRQGVVDPRRARRAARAAWAASQCRGDAAGEARARPTHHVRRCEVAVWLLGIETVSIPQSRCRPPVEPDARIRFMPAPLTRGIGYSGDRHRERFQRRCAVMGGVIAGPFVEIAKARGEPKGLRSCCAHPEIATDWHRPRFEQTGAGRLQNCTEPRAVPICSGHQSWVLPVVAEGMPDFSSQEPIVKDVNVGARHR